MGIFSRLSDLLQSNLNDLIDRAEDPEKMVRQIIADMQTELNKAVQNYSKVRSGQILTEKKYNDAVKASQNWEDKARNALLQGDRELAKQALARKVSADEEVVAYKEMCGSFSEQVNIAQAQVETLKLKLEDAKSRQAILIARAEIAETQKKLSEVSGKFGGSSAFEKFSRMEEKVSGIEAEAKALNEIAEAEKITETFAKLETDSKVNSELERLISEMNITETSEEE